MTYEQGTHCFRIGCSYPINGLCHCECPGCVPVRQGQGQEEESGLFKEFIVYSEMVRGGRYRTHEDPNFIEKLNLRVKRGERIEYEFIIELVRLSTPTIRLEVFADAFKAFKDCPEVFHVLSKYHVDFHRSTPEGLPEDILESVAKELEECCWYRRLPFGQTVP